MRVDNPTEKRKRLLIKLRNIYIYHLFLVPFYILFFPYVFEKLQYFLFSNGGKTLIVTDYTLKKSSGVFLFLFLTSLAFAVSSIFGLIHENLINDHTFMKSFKVMVLILYISITFLLLPLSLFCRVSVSEKGISKWNGILLFRKEYSYDEIRSLKLSRYAVVRNFVPVFDVGFSDGVSVNLMNDTPDESMFIMIESHIYGDVRRYVTLKGFEYFHVAFTEEKSKEFLSHYEIREP